MSKSRLDELREACQVFHEEHPEVWELFVRFTLERIDRGFEHYGARAIMERVRWETNAGGEDPELTINDHYAPFYARRFMGMHREHGEFFRTREQTSAGRLARGEPAPLRTSWDEAGQGELL